MTVWMYKSDHCQDCERNASSDWHRSQNIVKISEAHLEGVLVEVSRSDAPSVSFMLRAPLCGGKTAGVRRCPGSSGASAG